MTSCEGYKMFHVNVVSESDEQPVPGAHVFVLNTKRQVLDTVSTDSLGKAVFVTGFGGMMFGGPKLHYSVSKPGYMDIEGSQRSAEIHVQMKKL
jgi:uncharacterized protein YfaS (alpha-2-macroglobulin family)